MMTLNHMKDTHLHLTMTLNHMKHVILIHLLMSTKQKDYTVWFNCPCYITFKTEKVLCSRGFTHETVLTRLSSQDIVWRQQPTSRVFCCQRNVHSNFIWVTSKQRKRDHKNILSLFEVNLADTSRMSLSAKELCQRHRWRRLTWGFKRMIECIPFWNTVQSWNMLWFPLQMLCNRLSPPDDDADNDWRASAKEVSRSSDYFVWNLVRMTCCVFLCLILLGCHTDMSNE